MHWTCPMSHEFIHALFIFIDYYWYVCTVVNKYTGMLICTLLLLQVLWPALCNRKQTPNSRKPGNFPHERHWSFNLGLITGTCITWCHLLYWPMRGQLGRDDDTILNSVNIRSVFVWTQWKRTCHISSFFRFELILSGEMLLTKNPYLVESRFWVSVYLSISLWGVNNR